MKLLYSILCIIIIIITLFIIVKLCKSNKTTVLPKTIYMYWDSGWGNNRLCDYCLQSWKYYNPNWKIVALDKNNIYNYLDFDMLNNIFNKKLVQHQADLIRVNLLNKHGGVWVDATIFCNKSLDEWLFKYMNTGFFSFKYNFRSGLEKYKLGNWFLASEKNNYIINTFANAYNKHWQTKYTDNYFGFHFLFNKLCQNDKKFKKMFRKIPFYDARTARITISKFYNPTIVLINKINNSSKKILDNTNIPMYKFKSRDYKQLINLNQVEGTNLKYIIDKIT